MSTSISDYLRQSVEAKDLPNIRGAILGIIDKNPQNIDVEELNGAINYVKAHGISNLFEENDSELDDPSRKDDYYYVLSSLKQNFSEKKLKSVVNLGKKRSRSIDYDKSHTDNTVNSEYDEFDYSRRTTYDEQTRRQKNPIRASRIVAAIAGLLAIIALIVILIKILTR